MAQVRRLGPKVRSCLALFCITHAMTLSHDDSTINTVLVIIIIIIIIIINAVYNNHNHHHSGFKKTRLPNLVGFSCYTGF